MSEGSRTIEEVAEVVDGYKRRWLAHENEQRLDEAKNAASRLCNLAPSHTAAVELLRELNEHISELLDDQLDAQPQT